MKQWEIRRGVVHAPWWYEGDRSEKRIEASVAYCLGIVDGRIGWLDFALKDGYAEEPPERLLLKPFEAAGGHASVDAFEQALSTYAISPQTALQDLPLVLFGSEWQRRVWKQLLLIPSGSMRTYGEVARRLGKPGAARAVGGAAHANPILLLVPCHRLVASGGGLGGYAEGIERKRSLLEHEGANTTVDELRLELCSGEK